MQYEEDEKCRQLSRVLAQVILPALAFFAAGILLLLIIILS